MSALPPKADILSIEIDVRFVPLADIHLAVCCVQHAVNSLKSCGVSEKRPLERCLLTGRARWKPANHRSIHRYGGLHDVRGTGRGEAAFALMGDRWPLMDDAVREQGGVVQDRTGDGIMTVFGNPSLSRTPR
jgi:hypothetical protein